jgi:hypothetical protein
VPLFTNCLEEAFSETYIPNRETLSSATGAKRGLASDRHRMQPQDVVVLDTYASRVRAQRTRPIMFFAVGLGIPIFWQPHSLLVEGASGVVDRSEAGAGRSGRAACLAGRGGLSHTGHGPKASR